LKTGTATPTIPPEMKEWAEKNGMTVEAKKPAQIAAVDRTKAEKDEGDLAMDGIGPQAALKKSPGIIHEGTKREMKDFKIAHAIGVLTLGADYDHLADAGLEIEVLRSQKSRTREPQSEEGKAILKQRQASLKDLNLGSEVAGSFFIPHEVHGEMIEKLRGQEIFMRMGVDYLPNSPKTQEWPKEGRSPNVYWPGDTPTSDLTTTDMDYGDVTLTLHEMACVVPIRLNLIKHAVGNVEQQVRNSIVKSMALEMTNVGLQGTGAKRPLGIFNQPAMSAYTTATVGVPTFDTLLDTINLAKRRDVVIDPTQSAWVMHVDYLSLFQKAKTGTAEYSYIVDLTTMPSERVLGLPVFTSSQIRTDLGVASNESRMILVGNKNAIMLADGGETELTILKELYRLQFKIGVLAMKEIDFGIRREEELQILTGLKTA
jgi:HK97 family phage major capsid protein